MKLSKLNLDGILAIRMFAGLSLIVSVALPFYFQSPAVAKLFISVVTGFGAIILIGRWISAGKKKEDAIKPASPDVESLRFAQQRRETLRGVPSLQG